MPRNSLALLVLLTALNLVACDPDSGSDVALEGDELEQDFPLPDLGIGEDRPLEWEHEDDAQTVSCSLGLPDVVLAGPSKTATVAGQISGVSTGTYRMNASRMNYPWWIADWRIYVGGNQVAAFNLPATNFVVSNATPFEVFMAAPPNAPLGGVYPLEVGLYTTQNQLVCKDVVSLELANCGAVAWWYTNPWPAPWYDGANCYVAYLPAGAQGFVWNNNWYVTPTNGNQCSIGSFDGVNCYIGSAPAGHQAFVWSNNLYFTL
jgi:hypothetical protein